ncbi:hypothetical protein ORI20_14120 [Mycobacterium sp. CVI_P3]|uniref:Uncharacterized protein n=1 Tax=Mycobacterium pinniadriaticum TaxID=2994102 RepID=A0ABT3SEA0_9MYCO|nr:hypothetical protein [Mycobacterium pinniadriaticum]MCX2931417.1 hypothetical protein [Mycobacterium pinniadriaticum]MCX2937841.1 hypothetical protein [Mycobacterium pinniadriaticum]
MDLTITALVSLIEDKSDLDAVAERMAGFNVGWYGGLTFERGASGPIWRLNIYRDGYPEVHAEIGSVLVTDASFVTLYQSVDQYNSAHPDNPITGS